MKRASFIPWFGPRWGASLLLFLIPLAVCVSLVTIEPELTPLVLVIAASLVVAMLFAADPGRLAFLIPCLLAVEYRFRLQSVSFTLAELSLLLVALLTAMRMATGRPLHWPGARKDFILVALLGTLALPSIWFVQDVKSAASTYRDLMLPLVFFLLLRAVNLERRQLYSLIRWFVILASASSLLGIVQYFTGQYLFFQNDTDALWQHYKILSAHGSPLAGWLGLKDTLPLGLYSGVNNFGTYLIIPACVSLAWSLSTSRSRKEKLFWLLCTCLQLIAVLFAFFRSAMLTIAVCWLVILWFRKRPVSGRDIVVLALAAIALLVATLQTDMLAWDQFGSLTGRGNMVLDAFDFISHHPIAVLTGGYTELFQRQYMQDQAIHNIELYTIVQFGIGAALSLLAFFVVSLRKCYLAAKFAVGEDRDLVLAIFAGVSGMLILMAQTTSFLDSIQNSMWLLFWLGAGTYLHTFQLQKLLPVRRPLPSQVFRPELDAKRD
jgi:O-antigen ligase